MVEGDPNAQAAPPTPAQAATDPEVLKLRAQVADLSARLTVLDKALHLLGTQVQTLAEREAQRTGLPRKPPAFKRRLAS